MKIIVGFGNELRGEDAFGIDCVRKLKESDMKQVKFISIFQLTPEIALELLEAKEIFFLDACYCLTNHYTLACSLEENNNPANLSHHISPKIVITILNNIYNKYPKYYIYSMLTNNFDTIINKKRYNNSIKRTCESENCVI